MQSHALRCNETRIQAALTPQPWPAALLPSISMTFSSVSRSRASVDISRTDERRAAIPKRRGSISGGVAPRLAIAPPASTVRVTAPCSSFSTPSSPSKGQAATMSKRLLPPAQTPTRRLLQRIPRRSSTSAESIVLSNKTSAQASGPPSSAGFSLRQVRQQQPDGKELRSFGVRPDSVPFQHADVSTMSLPRHVRTRSMLTVYGATKTPPLNIASKVAISTAVEKHLTPADQSTAQPSSASKLFSTSPSSLASTIKLLDETTSNLDEVTLPGDLSLTDLMVAELGNGEDVRDIAHGAGTESKGPPLQRSPTTASVQAAPPTSSPPGGESVPSPIDVRSRAEMLREAATHGTGLTRDAAKSLEQEFSSQERILQGLQRDNERKTVEVEEMRRQKARLEEFCARYFGAEHWRDVVFGTAEQPRSAIQRRNDETSGEEEQKAGLQTPQQSSTTKSSMHDLDDQSCSSQAIVEGLLRTLSSPSVPSQISSSSVATAHRTPMFSTPSHRSTATAQSATLPRPRTPPARRVTTPFDSSCMSALDDVSFASALDASTVVDLEEDGDGSGGAKEHPLSVRVPRAALQAVMDAQRQLLLAVQGFADGVV